MMFSASLFSKRLSILLSKGYNNTKSMHGRLFLAATLHGTMTEVVISKFSDKGILWKHSIQKIENSRHIFECVYER